MFVEVLDAQEGLAEDELGLFLGKLGPFRHVVEELAARTEVHHQVQVVELRVSQLGLPTGTRSRS